MVLADIAARGKLDHEFNFMVLPVQLTTSTAFSDLVEKLSSRLQAEMLERKDLKATANYAWDFVSKWSIMGVEYRGPQRAANTITLIDEFAAVLADCLKPSKQRADGILILIDEADKADPAYCNIGEFIKLVTERLTRLGAEHVTVGRAGLPIVTQRLKQGHESSLRVLETFMLEPLLDEEARQVVHRALRLAKDKNPVETKITPDALDHLVHLSEGYPHFIQQFGYCAFEKDADNVIDRKDVNEGGFMENGALDPWSKVFRGNVF